MARLPFNPDLIRPRDDDDEDNAARGAARQRGDEPMTVSELAGRIRGALDRHMPTPVRVVGEVSNLSKRTHWFFSLKDGGACVRCVCFASSARRVRFEVNDGIEVIATGRIDFYDQQGHVQLYVDRLEPVGIGELELRFRALCDELREKGYFAVERKKPLPAMPQCVAVVTSRTSAALQDVINTAQRRWPGCRLLLHDVRVQGAAAAPEVAAAIRTLGEQGERLGVDAIVLTRGGGSIEDLWAFNERIVADAILRCELPIVAAIGHETDTTIAELVADERCATPTQAVMRLVPDRAALVEQVRQTARRLMQQTRRVCERQSDRLTALAGRAVFRQPNQLYRPVRDRLEGLARRLRTGTAAAIGQAKQHVQVLDLRLSADLPRRLHAAQQRLETIEDRLGPAMQRAARDRRDRVASLSRQLEAVSPRQVLQRGYSITLDDHGHALRDAAETAAGARLRTVLAAGEVMSRVEGEGADAARVEAAGGTATSGAEGEATNIAGGEVKKKSPRRVVKKKVKRKKRPRAMGEEDQGSLF